MCLYRDRFIARKFARSPSFFDVVEGEFPVFVSFVLCPFFSLLSSYLLHFLYPPIRRPLFRILGFCKFHPRLPLRRFFPAGKRSTRCNFICDNLFRELSRVQDSFTVRDSQLSFYGRQRGRLTFPRERGRERERSCGVFRIGVIARAIIACVIAVAKFVNPEASANVDRQIGALFSEIEVGHSMSNPVLSTQCLAAVCRNTSGHGTCRAVSSCNSVTAECCTCALKPRASSRAVPNRRNLQTRQTLDTRPFKGRLNHPLGYTPNR